VYSRNSFHSYPNSFKFAHTKESTGMQDIGTELRKHFAEDKLKLSLTDRYAFAGDAGFYYLLPKAVVQPDCEEDIENCSCLPKSTISRSLSAQVVQV
jgi:hypothetical protein